MASSGESASNCFDTSSISDPSKAVNGYSSDYYGEREERGEVTLEHAAQGLGTSKMTVPAHWRWNTECVTGLQGRTVGHQAQRFAAR